MKRLYFALFTLSGFAGLIYESIWSHYLKLFLGHAAYAQTLVLAIFMGGMALGAWICSRYSARWKNLLLAYALTEGLIGVAALLFHDAFDGFLQFAYFTLIPSLGTAETVALFKWAAGALFILPQSILLGMTFPLMSAGIIRRYPEQPGATVAMLYFSNSIGAAVGVLVSGFVLIAWIGLPGTIRLAGVINLALALIVWRLARAQKIEPAFTSSGTAAAHGSYAMFLAIAALTGLSSFVYEIVWIRMLSLVLGSSTHAFELMLSAFILGLALGGLWIKRRIDGISNPAAYLAAVQIFMGVLAMATLPLYGYSFDFMQWIMHNVPRTEAGYVWFNLASQSIAIGVMLPATFCAGMTLPLITYTLITQGHGEKSIGHVYSANTVGAIIGVLFATHWGLPALGLKNLLALGAAIDIALGIALLWLFAASLKRWIPVAYSVAGLIALALGMSMVNLSPQKMASGVYRFGGLYAEDAMEVLFHRDGKTASIDVLHQKNSTHITIATNGKLDASINMDRSGRASPDEVTMTLAAALPLALNPKASQAAVIGFGSGMTTHAFAMAPMLNSIDTIEIEASMLEGAEYFRPRVELAYRSPKSHVYIDDAKTFFSTYNKKYDIIASEPSNPWVSGTASLFTEEFYRLIKHFLNPEGELVQWIQLYEIDEELVASVVKALSTQFSDYAIYVSDDENMLLIAKNGGALSELSPRLFTIPGMAAELSRYGIRHLQDLNLHKIGSRKTLGPLFDSYPIAKNSDYYPVLDLRAIKSRFLQRGALELVQLPRAGVPILHLLEANPATDTRTQATPNAYLPLSELSFTATLLRDFVLHHYTDPQYGKIANDLQLYAHNVRSSLIECDAELDPVSWVVSVVGLAQATLPYLSNAEFAQIWRSVQNSPCYAATGSTKKTWIELMLALAELNASHITQYSLTLLQDDERDATTIARFLMQAAVTGALLQNNHAIAQTTWERYVATAYPDGKIDLPGRLVLSHIQSSQQH